MTCHHEPIEQKAMTWKCKFVSLSPGEVSDICAKAIKEWNQVVPTFSFCSRLLTQFQSNPVNVTAAPLSGGWTTSWEELWPNQADSTGTHPDLLWCYGQSGRGSQFICEEILAGCDCKVYWYTFSGIICVIFSLHIVKGVTWLKQLHIAGDCIIYLPKSPKKYDGGGGEDPALPESWLWAHYLCVIVYLPC